MFGVFGILVVRFSAFFCLNRFPLHDFEQMFRSFVFRFHYRVGDLRFTRSRNIHVYMYSDLTRPGPPKGSDFWKGNGRTYFREIDRLVKYYEPFG